MGKALAKLKKAKKTKTLADIEKHRRRLQKAEDKLKRRKERKVRLELEFVKNYGLAGCETSRF